MEGQVSDVRADGGNIHLVVTGRFWFDQQRGQQSSFVEIKSRMRATLRQGKPFFAMVGNWLARQGRFAVESADVLRATDHDLR